jgi:hypothetical protein
MKLKGLQFADVAEIQETVTDELKKVQIEEFSAAFQKLYDRAKACIYANGAHFELKKVCVFLTYLRFKKKVLKLLDRTGFVMVLFVMWLTIFMWNIFHSSSGLKEAISPQHGGIHLPDW